jgi:short subunit dehydrogenase-like uncharacterized protein
MSAPMSKEERASRAHDIVVWGATGFTGRLVAEYLLRRCGARGDVRWALGGRSREKLERVRAELAVNDPEAAELPLLVGDARDPASLAPIVSSTRVMATTVGPYAVHGRELVASCVEHGTHYCDLTGEPQFVRAMIDAHHERAQQTGARIVHCCGYDSIPSDLGTLMLQDAMNDRHGVRCVEVKYFAGESKGGVSGGTIASMLNAVEEMTRDPSVRRLVANPYVLDPGRRSRGPDRPDQKGVRFDEDLGKWTGPFVMAAINTRVVRRTNALLGYRWGEDFRYSEVMSFAGGPSGAAKAAAVTAGLALGMGALAIPPLRRLLQAKVLPAPGEGPPREAREAGYFVSRLIGLGEATGGGRRPRLLGLVRGKADPGYGETAKMFAESALCLALDELSSPGGIVTPAFAMGQRLLGRLRDAGMVFDVSEMPT